MIRRYKEADKDPLLDLIDLNIPDYFDPAEKKEFEHYLLYEKEDYFVYTMDNETIACAGINYFEDLRIARLSWDMVHPAFQGKGIGRKLTEHRLAVIASKENIDNVIVRTSQFAYKFYGRFGFLLKKVEEDFWAKSYHLYEMELKL